ncbi:MAG: hypothetical protein HYZ42_07080, partial [Bacteroidetes bacterium]|nr:hypothetical protein [Bacteroidota bacterium]
MKQSIITILLVLTSGILVAQSNSQVSSVEPSSGNNSISESSQSESIGVDLYTGRANINLPIYKFKSVDIEVPISLNYINSQGIKVQDYAKTAGLGWQVSAGGGISRIVRGIPDENSYGYISLNNPNGANVKSMCLTGHATNGDPFLAPGSDAEPDLFNVSTPFFSFYFSFDENGVPIIPNNTGYKVVSNIYHVTTNTTITFEVIDKNGNHYYFGSTLSSQDNQTTEKKYKLPNGNTGIRYNTFPSNWYLDKIVTFNSKDVIDLYYTTGNSYTIKYYSYQHQSFYYNNSYYQLAGNFDLEKKTINNLPKYLSAIESSLGRVEFENIFDRLDVPQVARLNKITIKTYDIQTQQKSKVLKQFNFNYSYFGTPSSDPDELRLKLNSLNFTDNSLPTANTYTLYAFDYNTVNNLPSRKSHQYDYWGYYNINPNLPNNTGSLIPYVSNRAPSLEGTSANILTGIRTLSGGTTLIQYEQNSYYNNGNISAGGLRVKNISRIIFSGNGIVKNYVYSEPNGNSTGTIYGFNNGSTINTLYNVLNNIT